MKGTAFPAHRSPEQERQSRRCSGDQGANLVEYAFLLALIAIICIAAVSVVGRNTCENIGVPASALQDQATPDNC